MQDWNWDPFPLPGQAVFDWQRQQVAAVSRAPGNLDLFVIGYDKHIWTTYWSAQTGWAADWFPLPGQAVFDWEHQKLAAVSRAPGNLDVFVIGYDKHIWTTYWNDRAGWAPEPFPLPGQAVFDWEHQQLAAVSRAPGNLDVFVIGYDKHLWTTYWSDQTGWAPGPFPLPGQSVFDWEHQQLAAVSRAQGNLDVFVIGYDKHIWTTYWGDIGASMTKLIDNGAFGAKYTVVVVGDGFTSGDQIAYNAAVDLLVTNGLFARDYFSDNKGAFNLVRINLNSVESGVSTKTYAADGSVTASQTRNTALGAIFNGDWAHCWVEDGPNTAAELGRILDHLVPDRRIVMLLLNNPGFGGCGGGGRLTLPLGVTWSTVAHEFGHALGRLADEYHNRNNAYTGPEPDTANLTKNTNRATLKWNWAVAATTPIPTGGDDYTPPKPAGWNDSQDVGLFEGGNGSFSTGIYRPVVNCRMSGNDPLFCPVCDRAMHSVTDPYATSPAGGQEHSMNDAINNADDGSYVRLRVRSQSGQLSVVSAEEVAGPFVEPVPADGAIVQEVVVSGRTVAVSDIEEQTIARSFSEPGPDGPGEHHVYHPDTFEFVVRVPTAEFRAVDPRDVTIRVGKLVGRAGNTLTLRGRRDADPTLIAGGAATGEIEETLNLGRTRLPENLASILRG